MSDLTAALSRMTKALSLHRETHWGIGLSEADQKRLEECVELVEAFQALGLQARQRTLAFVRSEVRRSLLPEA